MSTRLGLYWAFGTWLSHVSLLSIEFRAGGDGYAAARIVVETSQLPYSENGNEREALLLAHYPWPGPDCIRRRREIVWAAGRVIEPAAKYGALVAAGIAVVLMLLHWRRHDSVRAAGELLGATTPFGYIVVGLGAAAVTFLSARRHAAAHPHWVYTADELATLDGASINWPAVPEELDPNANGEACAANCTTDGLGTSSPGQRASSGVNPIWSAAATLLGRTLDPVPVGTASCSTSTACGSTPNKPSTTFIYARTASGALAPTSSRAHEASRWVPNGNRRPNGSRCARVVLSIKSHSISGSQRIGADKSFMLKCARWDNSTPG